MSMASIQHSLLSPSPLCCCTHALLHPRTRKISPTPRLPDGTFSTAKPFLLRDFSERGGTLAWRMEGRRRLAVAGAGKGPFFGGGRRQGSTARTVGNLAFVALVAYLAVSGQFRWLLDAIVSLWLILVFLPIVGLGALVFFARRNILQNNCPNCGKSFRILKTSLKNGPQFCPYCTQPFSVQDDKFVRESASFSSGRPTASAQAFNELFNRGSKGEAPSGPGTIVDIEAEVTDIE